MKKTLCLLLSLFFVMAATSAFAAPAKDLYEGKNKDGNTNFTNFVDDNYPGEGQQVTGWVQYHRRGDSLKTTWVVDGLVPGASYQLKLHSKAGDTNVGEACGAPNSGAIWECGFWGTESFLVMATVAADVYGHIGLGIRESRLPVADYTQMQFIITEVGGAWSSAWTWENPAETISAFKIVPASVDLCFKNEAGPDESVLDDPNTTNDESADNWQCHPDGATGKVTYARAENGENMTLTAGGLAPDTWYFVEIAEKTQNCSWVRQTNSDQVAEFYGRTDEFGELLSMTFDAALTDYTEINVKNAEWALTPGGWIQQVGNGWGYVLYTVKTTPLECTYVP